MEEPPYDWRTIASDLDDSTYIVDGLRPGRDYRFRVRARGPSGTVSEPSPAVSLYKALGMNLWFKVLVPVREINLCMHK
jgi:hypothetical protein